MGSVEGTMRSHGEKTLPPTITKKETHQAQTIAARPEIVEQVDRTPSNLAP